MTEITAAQRTAWAEITDTCPSAASEIFSLLPSELTNPQPALPTEPGYYLDKGTDIWLLSEDEGWIPIWNNGAPLSQTIPADWGPFTRLVPERPQITEAEIDAAWTNTREDESIQRHRDGSMSVVGAFHAGFHAALANGTDRG